MNNFCHPANIIWVVSNAEAMKRVDLRAAGTVQMPVILRRGGIAVFLLLLITAPALAAVSADIPVPESTDPLAQDDPVLIANLKTHVADVGQSQDARMGGVIAYIDSISSGRGSAGLRDVRDDYLIAASTIPLMQSGDDIAEARRELGRLSRCFAEETTRQLAIYNGNITTMRAEGESAMQAMEASYSSMKDSLWLAKDSARLEVFNRDLQQRTLLLRQLSRQGIDVSKGENVSQQIESLRPMVREAVEGKSLSAIRDANARQKTLNQEFRKIAGEYQNDREIGMKRAAILAMG